MIMRTSSVMQKYLICVSINRVAYLCHDMPIHYFDHDIWSRHDVLKSTSRSTSGTWIFQQTI